MLTIKAYIHTALPTLFATLIAIAAGSAFAALIPQQEDKNADQSLWPGLEKLRPDLENSGKTALGERDAAQELSQAIEHGLWTRACGLATDALAQHKQSLDTLGVFAICQALVAQREATDRALSRLRDVEPLPAYYTTLTQGVDHLRSGAIDKAEADFNQVLKVRHDDPLAMYFRGELLYARHKDADAIAAFNAVLKTWPDYAPALSAAARLMAVKGAPKQTMDSAISMSERAALIEPMNLAYWKQMADLCDQVGQHDRAHAIRLQWLTRPKLPVVK